MTEADADFLRHLNAELADIREQLAQANKLAEKAPNRDRFVLEAKILADLEQTWLKAIRNWKKLISEDEGAQP